jgi:hypothetical protein
MQTDPTARASLRQQLAAGAPGAAARVDHCLHAAIGVVQGEEHQAAAKDAVASILALKFVAAEEPPAGAVEIMLAGGGGIRLDVEAIDALLADWGEPWSTPRRPDHERGG